MNYTPSPIPLELKSIPEYLQRELQSIAAASKDNADSVFYRTLPARQGSLSVGISANWKVAGNVLLVSTSVTHTFTGIARDSFSGMREIVFINVGTGVAVLKSQATESSASNRFALALDWQLSAGASGTLWRDPYGSRWRGIAKA